MSSPAIAEGSIRTLTQRGRGDPFDPAHYSEIVKPGELVDIVELNPLTLADSRTYNLLIANAGTGSANRSSTASPNRP